MNEPTAAAIKPLSLPPCEHRLETVLGTNGKQVWQTVSCRLLNLALGWEHRAGESLCARCIAHCTAQATRPEPPAASGTTPLSKAYRQLALLPVEAKMP